MLTVLEDREGAGGGCSIAATSSTLEQVRSSGCVMDVCGIIHDVMLISVVMQVGIRDTLWT